MSVKATTAYFKIKALTKRFRIIRGSMSAGKTYAILAILFEIAITQPKQIITVVTSTFRLLHDGVAIDMKNLFINAGLPFDDWFNKSDKDLTFQNGSLIQFRNLDSNDELKGRGSRRDYLFCNEVDRLTWTALEPYIVRTNKAVYMDFNHSRHFFVDDRFLEVQRDDVDFITLTYRDNELIPAGELETIISRIKASKEPNASDQLKLWVSIFCYGLKGQLTDRQIYTYEFCEDIPPTARRIASGMDFGVSPDPTSLIDLYIDGPNLYADEVFTLNNLLPETIPGSERPSVAQHMESIGYPKGQLIVGDSSGRSTILDLRYKDFNIFAVKKNISVYDGIQKLRSYRMFITKESKNLKNGIESWFWKVDANGKIIPIPDKHEPDTLAALRYGIIFHQSD